MFSAFSRLLQSFIKIILGFSVVFIAVFYFYPNLFWLTPNHSAQTLLIGTTATPLPALVTLPQIAPDNDPARHLHAPNYFEIHTFANEVNWRPRLMTFGPDGVLYVAMLEGNIILGLPDRDKDGYADGYETVAIALNKPNSIEWHDAWLYVAEEDKIERFSEPDLNGLLTKREVIVPNLPHDGGHDTRTLHFGPDGKMYVSVGSECNFCAEPDPRRGTILRFEPDGKIPSDNPFATAADVRRRAIWAQGIRNSVDFVWRPDGNLWASTNGMDLLGDHVPPEVVAMNVQIGQHYGWPYCYNPFLGANHGQSLVPNPQLTAPKNFDCAKDAQAALFTEPAHSAPIGMVNVTSSQFPAHWQNDLLVALHGSWNISDPANYRDCKIQHLIIRDGVPIASETFITGWRPADAQCGANGSGRPAGLVFGPDGALYISDDFAGRIYRVAFAEQP